LECTVPLEEEKDLTKAMQEGMGRDEQEKCPNNSENWPDYFLELMEELENLNPH
jgi:Zn/Cd-binding protein ZinT